MENTIIAELKKSSEFIEKVYDISFNIVQKEVDDFNDSLRLSEAWESRKIELLNEDPICLYLNNSIGDISNMKIEFSNEENKIQINNLISDISNKLDIILTNTLTKEFGLIKLHHKYFKRDLVSIFIGLESTNTTYDELIDRVVSFIKKEYNIYI